MVQKATLSKATLDNIQKIIDTKNYLLNLNIKNQKFISAIYQSGIIDTYELIQAIWNIANKRPFNFGKDDQGYPGFIYIWNDLPLKEVLIGLELEMHEFKYCEALKPNKNVYFKFRFNLNSKELVILSIHISD